VLAPLWLAALLIAPSAGRLPQEQRLERPGVRAHHWLVYDETRELVLLCGGSTPVGNEFVFYDDIWSFDGDAWVPIGELVRPESGLRAVSHPSGDLVAFGGFRGNDDTVGELRRWRDGTWSTLDAASDKSAAESGFVFDVVRARFVLFGGAFSGSTRGTTWEWDGAAWQAFEVPGPGPRSTHGMVYDRSRKKTVLFGGTNGARLGDTWEWDGHAWTEVPGPGPAARLAPAMTYDTKRGRTVLFGGAGAGGALGDTWVYDGTRWQELEAPGPSPRISPAMAYDAARDRIVLFGGRRAWPVDLADTWVFDGTSWKEVAGL
jgi:hypothetical protein